MWIPGLCLLLLVPCVVTDLRNRMIPVPWCIFCGILAAAFHLIQQDISLLQTGLGAAEGSLFLLYSLLSRRKLGLGDGILITALGITLGGRGLPAVLLISFLLTAAFGGILILLRRKKGKDSLPFAPFLLAGTAVICLLQRTGLL